VLRHSVTSIGADLKLGTEFFLPWWGRDSCAFYGSRWYCGEISSWQLRPIPQF